MEKMQLQLTMENQLIQQYTHLLDVEIPTQRQQLKSNVLNLEQVAQYCEDIYTNSNDQVKINLLNETKAITTQALASIAYQIHMLGNTFIDVLKSEADLIDSVALKVTKLGQDVNIHKEKVARREIGGLTANKLIMHNVKIKRPEIDEKQIKYVRKPIDYSLLDDIGHGVKVNKQEYAMGRQNSYSSTHSSGSDIRNSVPSLKPPTPPLLLKGNANGTGTVRSTASSYYRTPVAPPSVPSEYLSRQELGIYSSRKELGLNDSGGIYGTANSYRRSSSQQQSEYSGVDTLDKRMATALIQQLSAGNNSISYASGNLIRTNLDNVDYALNGTLTRHAQQLASQMYNRSNSVQGADLQNMYQLNSSQTKLNQIKLADQQQRRTSNISQRSVTGSSNASQNMYESPSMNNRNTNIYNDDSANNIYQDPGHNQLIEEDENHDLIPSWVPIDRCIEKVITTFDWNSSHDDELTFKENQYIYVTRKNDDHWYEGIMQDEEGRICTGLYPYNYAKCVKKYQPDVHSDC